MKTDPKKTPENQRHPERRLTIGGQIFDLDSFVEIALFDKSSGQKIRLDLNLIEEQLIQPAPSDSNADGNPKREPDSTKDSTKSGQAHKGEVEITVSVCYRVAGLMRSKDEQAKSYKILLHLAPEPVADKQSDGEPGYGQTRRVHPGSAPAVGRALEGELTLWGLDDVTQARNYDLELGKFEIVLPSAETATTSALLAK